VNSSIFLQFKREIADPLRIEDFTLDDNRPMILAKRQGTALGITGRKKLAFIFTQATPEKAFRSFAALFRDRRGGAEYVLTGPQSLSQFEQVSAIGSVIGRSLRIEAARETYTTSAGRLREKGHLSPRRRGALPTKQPLWWHSSDLPRSMYPGFREGASCPQIFVRIPVSVD